MKTNTKMKQYLDYVETEGTNNFTIDLTKVGTIIFPQFFEWDGCILLSQQRESELPNCFSPDQFLPDRTAFEADYNHIHLNDFFGEAVNPNAILKIGIKILEVWAAVLYKQFSGRRRFMLLLSFDGEEVVLRFYVVRQDELEWLDTSKLESYLDGLMLIEI